MNCFYFVNYSLGSDKKFDDKLKTVNHAFARKNLPKITDKDLAELFVDLQFNENIQIKTCESDQDFADLVHQFTKAISEVSVKSDVNLEFLLADHNTEKSRCKLDKDGTGMITLWTNILEKFQLVTKPQAHAIVSKYPSIYSLMQVKQTSFIR
jgi:hypothetical protein